jgi:hypothetical protein
MQYDFVAPETQCNMHVSLPSGVPDTGHYIVEFELSVSPGADLTLGHCTLNNGSCPLQFGVFANGVLQVFVDPSAPDPRIRANIANIQTGRTVTVAIVADHPTYSVYVDQQLVGRQFTVPAGLGHPEPSFFSLSGKTGSLRISGLRYYALP